MAGRNEQKNNAERIWATAQLYCDQVREIGKVVLQYSHCTCDTTRALGARAPRGAARGVQGSWAQRAGARARRLCAAIRLARHPRHGAGQAATLPHARSLGVACARRLSCGCAHSALGQFLTQYCF